MTVRDERNTLEFDLKVTQQKYEDKCDYALNLDRQNCALQKDLSSAKDEITHKASKISSLEQVLSQTPQYAPLLTPQYRPSANPPIPPLC